MWAGECDAEGRDSKVSRVDLLWAGNDTERSQATLVKLLCWHDSLLIVLSPHELLDSSFLSITRPGVTHGSILLQSLPK